MRRTGTVEGRDWIPLGRTQMINKDDFNTICENSIQLFFFFNASFFFKGTKNKAPEKCSEAVRGTDLNEGNLYYTVIKGGNMKTHGHDRDTNQPL